MDVKQLQGQRNNQLSEFTKKYTYLKSEYSNALNKAISEGDTQTRESMITQIQKLNTQLTDELRTILGDLSKGVDTYNPESINKLMQELIEYQKEHQALSQSQDKLKTLKLIKFSTDGRLKEITTMYSIFLFLLIILCLFVVFLVMKTSSFTQSISTNLQTISNG